MNDGFEPLESGEVISVQHDTQVLGGHNTFKVGELNNAIKGYLEHEIADWNEEKSAWFSRQGIDCEAFRFSSAGWQKGRIRLSLEFCPEDDLNSTASKAIATSNNTTIDSTQASLKQSVNSPIQPEASVVPVETRNQRTELQSEITTPASVPTTTTSIAESTLPAVGIATTGAIPTAAIATNNPSVSIPSPPEIRSSIETKTTTSATDVVLEPKDLQPDRDARDREVFDEIAFEIDRSNGTRSRIEANSEMELDLTDLGLDISEHDFLNFETNWIPDPAQEFINFSAQDDRIENSGMLIDEVWHEIENQPNWPGIN
jgi:hypothetical protein